MLFLQGLRGASGGFFDQFFMSCTEFGNIHIILFLIGILYWAYDKKFGEYLLVSFAFSRLLNSFIKLTTCVYRPWIEDSKIHPYEGALKDATGFSLPSGHATSSEYCSWEHFLKEISQKDLKFFQ